MTTSLQVVVPVLNEEKDLESNTRKLHRFLSDRFGGYDWRIMIAENGSTDSTLDIARRLSGEMSRVGFIHVDERGRGRAVRKAWLDSDADILAYMDVDLSTDLTALPELVAATDAEGHDIAIGSRLNKDSQVIGRSFRREVMSRTYSLIIRSMYLTGFMDAQCGFKAIRGKAAKELVPLVEDFGWFFDSELLILAERNGYRIKEIPVRWTDDPNSKVQVVSTAYEDVKGLLRLRFGGLARASRELSTRRGDG